MVATEVVMPKMGYDMTEGTILKWRKQEGEAVTHGEILAEIETTKVTVEVEAYASGILRKILAPEGQTVPVGEAIAIIAAPDEADAAETAPSRKQAPRTQAAAPAAAHRETPAPPPAPPKEGRTSASPLARKVARELSVDIAQVRGTGPGGRIIREDVERFAETATPARVTVVPRLGAEARPLTRIRQTIARRMTESKQQAPHFYVTVDIDMGEALALRRALNAASGEQGKVSVTDMLVKAAALALVEFPDMNASYAGETVQVHGRVNIGVAVAREEGLITPVIPDCHLKTLTEIAREARGMIERARVGKMKPEDLTEGTFSVSNLGMFDVESFVAIINPPEAAILAVGRVEPRPVVVEGAVVVRERMKATLSVDHRVADGVRAAQFLRQVRHVLETPHLLVA